jgi:hypothetical protein
MADRIAIVCFVSDPSIVETLKPHPAEVDAIFTHPLRGCLDGRVGGEDAVGLSERGGQWWPHEEEYHVSLMDPRGRTVELIK